jgi:hypothetical protein
VIHRILQSLLLASPYPQRSRAADFVTEQLERDSVADDEVVDGSAGLNVGAMEVHIVPNSDAYEAMTCADEQLQNMTGGI